MSLVIKINDAIKQAMLAKDSYRLGALRAIKSEILKEQTKEGGTGELTEEESIKLLQRLVKQRRDAAEVYISKSRRDLADEELAQAVIIEEYLPKQLSDEEIKTELKRIIEQLGVTSVKEMGKIMGVASKELAGRADNKRVSVIIKEILEN